MVDAPFFEPFPEPPDVDEPPEVDLSWMPPQHAVGVLVPLDVEVHRGRDVVVRVTHATVHRRGLELHVATWLRPGAPRRAGRFDWPGAEPRCGVRLEDGTRIGHDPRAEHHPSEGAGDRVSWMMTGGEGGSLRWRQSWWLHPIPEGDRLDVVVAWEHAGVPESSAVLDLAALRAAAEREEVLWDPPPAPEELGVGWFGYASPPGPTYRTAAAHLHDPDDRSDPDA